MGGVWFGFKVGMGVALAFAVIAAIAMLIKAEYKRRKSLLYGIRKLRRLQDETDALYVLQVKENVAKLKERIKTSRTEEEKSVNQALLDLLMAENEDVLNARKPYPKFPIQGIPKTKEELYEVRRNLVGDEKWAEEKIQLDKDWEQIKKLL